MSQPRRAGEPEAQASSRAEIECNRRILVIDDNPAIHEDFRKILCTRLPGADALAEAAAALFGEPEARGAERPFELASAFQGAEGLERVAAALESGKPYAMTFLDVRMPPGWDGIETAERLWERDPDLQIVLCTAYSDYAWDEVRERLGRCDRLLILKSPSTMSKRCNWPMRSPKSGASPSKPWPRWRISRG